VTACAGVDGCKGGWIAVKWDQGADPQAAIFRHFSDFMKWLPIDAVIVVDMPIGLPEQAVAGGRIAERTVRPLLGKRKSSVFSVPSRKTVESACIAMQRHPYAKAYQLALAEARRTSDPPTGLSRQSFGILPKIHELDQYLRANPLMADHIHESHPEAAFCYLNDQIPMSHGKSKPEGESERKSLLRRCGLPFQFIDMPAPKGAKTDDFLDACVMLLVAERIRDGKAVPHPSPPERDAHNLPIAIWT
jgi:predicted RNase H-like nuclease